jgi:hypothetical protein
MRPGKANSISARTLIAAAARGELDEVLARQLYRHGPEVVTLALLAASKRIAELQRRCGQQQTTPSTPSAMVPVYAKPNASKRRKRPGARKGHPGTRRAKPARIDRRVEHRLKRCPHCHGPVQLCKRKRTRIIEDIPEPIEPVVTEHTIHRDYCPVCKKHVEPVVPEAMPGATLGHNLVGLTSWFHYGLGITIDQVVDILGYHLQTRLTPGGLVDAWRRLAVVLIPWYQQIGTQARDSAVLHADETGWRVSGQTYWLWCFANQQVCYYMIDRCRGSPALQKFFTEAFAGTLIHDFWAPYESVETDDRQYCLVHLLRELEKVDQHNDSPEWQAFAKKLRRLVRDGIRLRKRPDFEPQRYESRIHLIDRRLTALAQWQDPDGKPVYGDADALRLAKRLRKHWDHLFTFLDKPEVPFENNFAERMIRPAVILRKNSQSNRSEQGAATQAILMSIYRTLRMRGHEPTKTIAAALKTRLETSQLPPLPDPIAANG